MAALGRDHQRRAAAIVGRVDRRAALEQQLDDSLGVHHAGVVGVAGRPHQRGELVAVAAVDGNPGIEQPADDRHEAEPGRIHDRGLAG